MINEKSRDIRLVGLRRFAISITALNVVGHLFLGFEQAIIVPIIALLTAYTLELLLETIGAWADNRPPAYSGSKANFIHFLLPAHIAALAISMLTFTNQDLMPVLFAVAVAIGSKAILRVPVGDGKSRHFFNPSNLGIAAALILYPEIVGMAPPYHFTENITGIWDFVLPALIFASGFMLNSKLTRRIPLISAWVGGFVLQALFRTIVLGSPLLGTLMPMTGLPFVLYTFYMITDPGTSPIKPSSQIIFGLSVAFIYSAIVMSGHVYGLFVALTLVSGIRGLVLTVTYWQAQKQTQARIIPDLEIARSDIL